MTNKTTPQKKPLVWHYPEPVPEDVDLETVSRIEITGRMDFDMECFAKNALHKHRIPLHFMDDEARASRDRCMATQ